MVGSRLTIGVMGDILAWTNGLISMFDADEESFFLSSPFSFLLLSFS